MTLFVPCAFMALYAYFAAMICLFPAIEGSWNRWHTKTLAKFMIPFAAVLAWVVAAALQPLSVLSTTTARTQVMIADDGTQVTAFCFRDVRRLDNGENESPPRPIRLVNASGQMNGPPTSGLVRITFYRVRYLGLDFPYSSCPPMFEAVRESIP